ncbi:hypothetical protein HKD37_05G013258 [Glycine soja]
MEYAREEVKEKKENSQIAYWCLMGDFNCVRWWWRKLVLGVRMVVGEREESNNFIMEMEIEDLPMIGRKFTWYRPNGKARSRLDRILVTSGRLNTWSGSSQVILDRNVLDHCPIPIKNNVVDWEPKPFRVLDCWFSDPTLVKVVEGKGRESRVVGWGAFVPKDKLKALKSNLKEWNANVFGDLVKKQAKDEKEFNDLDKKEDEANLEKEEGKRKKVLQEEFLRVAISNESLVRQKLRMKWVKENSRRVKGEVEKFFKDRFCEKERGRPRCFELVFGLKVNFKSRLRTIVVYMETEKRYTSCGGDEEVPKICRESRSFYKRKDLCGVRFWVQNMRGWIGLKKEEVLEKSSLWWRDLCRTCGGMNEGDKFMFWRDKWLRDQLLAYKYPRGEVRSWDLRWLRQWFEWEKSALLNFEGELEEARLCKDITDSWSWRLNNFASYSIKKGKEPLAGLGGPMARARTKKAKEALQ